MEKLMMTIGVALAICALIAVGLYGWHGQWGPVLLTLGAGFVGKMTLGFFELLVMPFSLPTIYFAKRGSSFPSFVFATLASLLTRAAYAAYCAAVLLYLMRTPGPPTWLSVALAVVVTGAPFHWAARRVADDSHPSNLDELAAGFGVTIAGILVALGVNIFFALAPLAILFFVSAVFATLWWMSNGVRKKRNSLQELIDSRIQELIDRGNS